MKLLRIVSMLAVIAVLGMAGCSSDDGGGDGADAGSDGQDDDPKTSVSLRITTEPDGPVADITGPIEGGRGMSLSAARPGPDLEAADYTEAEYRAAGTATSYRSEGELPTDGTFELEPGDEADYATRIVVRRPAGKADFNGTVVVEWLNVSGGADAGPDYTYLADEIVR